MALIKCYECEKEISDKATACPHCGAPVEKGSDKLLEKISTEKIVQQGEEENEKKLSDEKPKIASDSENKNEMTMVLTLGLFALIAFFIIKGIVDSPSTKNSTTIEETTTYDPMADAFIGDEHYELKQRIKSGMHNPDSYEFVSGRRWSNDNGDGSKAYFAEIYFRGTNAFGAIVTNNAVATLDFNGNILSISGP